jgi:hypothetical protein
VVSFLSDAETTSTFRLEFYPRQGNYVGKIEHTLSQDKKVLKGLDQRAITDFITTHLPRVTEKPLEEIVVQVSPVSDIKMREKDEPRRRFEPVQPKAEAPLRQGVVREIKVRQGRNFIQGIPPVVRQRLPFMVNVKLHLPSPPTQDKMDLWVSSYSVRLVAQKAPSAKPAAERVVANDLTPQQAEYETTITMPPLSSGNYTLHAYALIPYAHLAVHETTALNVA